MSSFKDLYLCGLYRKFEQQPWVSQLAERVASSPNIYRATDPTDWRTHLFTRSELLRLPPRVFTLTQAQVWIDQSKLRTIPFALTIAKPVLRVSHEGTVKIMLEDKAKLLDERNHLAIGLKRKTDVDVRDDRLYPFKAAIGITKLGIEPEVVEAELQDFLPEAVVLQHVEPKVLRLREDRR